jgi:CheY-like chemotaxis protein/DNA-binding XRE family transcriptional regulator
VTIEEAFGIVVRRLRRELNLSQDKLSEASGLDRTFISHIERGRQQPSLISIFALAGATNSTPSRLMAETELLLKIHHPDIFKSEYDKWRFDWVMSLTDIRIDNHESLAGNETIMFVDDEELLRDMMASFLGNYGYRVILAEDGEDALEQFHSTKVDLVIMDVVMPRRDGISAYNEMKRANPGSLVFLVSGYHDNAAHLAGNIPIIQKPYSPVEIIKIIRKSLDGKSIEPGVV